MGRLYTDDATRPVRKPPLVRSSSSPTTPRSRRSRSPAFAGRGVHPPRWRSSPGGLLACLLFLRSSFYILLVNVQAPAKEKNVPGGVASARVFTEYLEEWGFPAGILEHDPPDS